MNQLIIALVSMSNSDRFFHFFRGSVFEPFFTTDKTGTGLGLYLARELCEANQAHLSLVEDNKPGCCFRITFAHPGRMI